ncbi:MAG: hypothetical protein FGM32_08315 [Candidatus Kapabacteria bacterium]|nr:hypothetical protein [Candidatus Kapabacteria bacterium]
MNRIMVVLAVVFGVLMGRAQQHESSEPGSPIEPNSNGVDTALVKEFIIEHYFRPLPSGAAALPWKQFDSLLDNWSFLLSREKWQMMNEQIRGLARGRIGVTTSITPYGNRVDNITCWGPAFHSGLLVGDIIEVVNDESIAGMNHKQSGGRIRGSVGTWLSLDVRRSDTCIRIFTYRNDFIIEPVTVAIVGRTMGVRITEFDEGLTSTFRKIVRKIDPNAIDTMVFDVRDNPGGSLSEVESLLCMMLDENDTVVSFRDRRNRSVTVCEGMFGGQWSDPGITIVVLQDSNSASASELFAGTLAVRRNATIIGTRSYGKGRVQALVPIEKIVGISLALQSAIGGLRMTVSTFHPGGRMDVDSVGVPADMPLAPTLRPVLPGMADALRLRGDHFAPTPEIVDSLNAAGYVGYAEAVWGERGSPFNAISELNRVRQSIPTPYWSCTADHRTVRTTFARRDEIELRRLLRQMMWSGVADSVVRMEPLERAFEHLQQRFIMMTDQEKQLERDRRRALANEFGIRLEVDGDGIIVTNLIPGMPAYAGGICIGDRIVAVADEPLATTIDEAWRQLFTASSRGGVVKLDVRRGRRQFPLRIEVGRDVRPELLTHLEGGVGYIDLTQVSETMWTPLAMARSIGALLREDVDELVLDMRGAGGSNPEVAVRMLELFARPNDTLLTIYRNGVAEKTFVAENLGAFSGKRVRIIIDTATSDAAEAFVGAMQRNGYARLLGMRTAGRGTERRHLELRSGTQLVITTDYVTTPSPAGVGSTDAMPIYPDIPLVIPPTPRQEVQRITSTIRDVLPWRSAYHMPTEDLISEYLSKLPNANHQRDAAPLAEAIWGDRGRAYNILAMVR